MARSLGSAHWPDEGFTETLNDIVAAYARTTLFPLSPKYGTHRIKTATQIRATLTRLLNQLESNRRLLFEAFCTDKEWSDIQTLSDPEKRLSVKETRPWILREADIASRVADTIAQMRALDATIEQRLPGWESLKSTRGKPSADADRYLVWRLRELVCSLPDMPPRNRSDPYASHWVERKFAPMVQDLAGSILRGKRQAPTLNMIKKLYDEFPLERKPTTTKKKTRKRLR